jgi:diacylglycerol kinase family enzyme
MPELCVIINRGAGRRKKRLEVLKEWLRRVWGGRVEFQETRRQGHAEELAERAAQRGFAIVAAAGGDGTVHEVSNGLLRAQRPEVEFTVFPTGSANDYADSLAWNFPAEPERKKVTTVDVGRVQSADGKERYFVCCLGLGFNARVTEESRRIDDREGIALYGLAALRALRRHHRFPKMELAFDDQPPLRLPIFMLSVMLARREGGFVMAPKARLDDGWLDYVHSGAVSRWEFLRLLLRVAILKGPPAEHSKVRQGRCRQVRVHSCAPLIVHVDGEFFCLPGDNFRELAIDIVPAGLRVRTDLLHEAIGRLQRKPGLFRSFFDAAGTT